MSGELINLLVMAFSNQLVRLRKTRGMTQQALADEVGIHVTQLRRYEAGTAQPTADVLRRLAIALRTSADTLLFDEHERGPDDELRLQFEAITRLDPDEKQVIREVVESMLIKHESKRWIKAG